MSDAARRETIALGYTGHPKVAIWVIPRNETPEGFSFEVINGRWRGRFDKKTQTLRVTTTKEVRPAVELWRGAVPYEYSNYNEAIAWIETQLEKADGE